MEYGEVLYQAMQLTDKQKHQLVYALTRGFTKVMVVEAKHENCKKQLWVYLPIMARVLDIMPQAILAKDRLKVHVYARWVVWNKLYEDGYSQNMIAKVSGYSHNIVQVGMQRIAEVKEHPRYDPYLADMYNKFNDELKNNE